MGIEDKGINNVWLVFAEPTMDDDVPDSAVDLVLKENVSVETGAVEGCGGQSALY